MNTDQDLNQQKGGSKLIFALLIIIALGIVGYFIFRSTGGTNTSDNVKTPETSAVPNTVPNVQAQTNNQNTVTPPPVAQDQQNNAAGQQNSSSASGIFLETMAKDHVYKNGQKGFNFVIYEADLTDTIVGDIGRTKNGTYFYKDPKMRELWGIAVEIVDEKGVLIPQKTTRLGEYVFFHSSLPFSSNGFERLCFEIYENGEPTDLFEPHQSVKKGMEFTPKVKKPGV